MAVLLPYFTDFSGWALDIYCAYLSLEENSTKNVLLYLLSSASVQISTVPEKKNSNPSKSISILSFLKDVCIPSLQHHHLYRYFHPAGKPDLAAQSHAGFPSENLVACALHLGIFTAVSFWDVERKHLERMWVAETASGGDLQSGSKASVDHSSRRKHEEEFISLL